MGVAGVDCVLSYHMGPLTCGVARFNHALARRLSVPVRPLAEPLPAEYVNPLISLKVSELAPADVSRLLRRLDELEARGVLYDVFLHGYQDLPAERRLVLGARAVYCGNGEIQSRLARERPDAVALWCPGTLRDRIPLEATDLSVFAFGMGHKIQVDHFGRLAELLNGTGRSWSLALSAALHEPGGSLADDFAGALGRLEGVLGSHLHYLGFLSDRAVHDRLSRTTYCAAFFEGGLRANNTTAATAMEVGAVLITNLDDHSPPHVEHMRNVLDIRVLTSLPTDPATLEDIARQAAEDAAAFGWDALVACLEGGP